MWRYGSNVLAFQYHPELHPLMALEKIHPTMSSIGRLDEAEQLESAWSLKERSPDVACMAAVLSHYRDHGLIYEQGAEVQRKESARLVFLPLSANKTSTKFEIQRVFSKAGCAWVKD
uniref:Glutamine amidotransferase domain-containing protein n=1 Tax=Dunaliella tertiolecta TaxID=3047 RepID=A0A7S3R5G0_DUNTE